MCLLKKNYLADTNMSTKSKIEGALFTTLQRNKRIRATPGRESTTSQRLGGLQDYDTAL